MEVVDLYSFFAKEGKVQYTEDRIPIRTLYVSSLHPNITEDILRKHFSDFGPLDEIRICQTVRNHKYAFVTYVEAEDAAKALNRQSHSIFRRRIRVSGADSWHQPKKNDPKNIEEQCSGSNLNVKNNMEETKDTILILNDDCLLHIFSFVDLFDLRQVEQTCVRFQDLTQIIYKKYRVVDFMNIKDERSLTLMETRDVLSQIGNSAQSLNIPAIKFMTSSRRIIDIVPRYCKNIKEIKIEGFVISFTTLKKFRSIFEQLEVLELKSCGITDQIERFLEYAKNLHTLNLALNAQITGKCLSKVHNLESVTLDNCVNLQPKYFSMFIQNNKTLKYLNINGCDRLNERNINDMVTFLTNLEQLVISNIYTSFNQKEMSKLAQIKSLKKIHIVFTCFSYVDELFDELAKANQLELLELVSGPVSNKALKNLKYFTKLKSLKLNHKLDLDDDTLNSLIHKSDLEEVFLGGCSELSDEGVFRIVQNAPNLKLIDISGCEKITNSVLVSINSYIHDNKLSHNKKLKMICGSTSIFDFENKNLNYLNVSLESTYVPTIDFDSFDDLMDPDQDMDYYDLGLYDDEVDDDDSDYDGLYGFDDNDLDSEMYYHIYANMGFD